MGMPVCHGCVHMAQFHSHSRVQCGVWLFGMKQIEATAVDMLAQRLDLHHKSCILSEVKMQARAQGQQKVPVVWQMDQTSGSDGIHCAHLHGKESYACGPTPAGQKNAQAVNEIEIG